MLKQRIITALVLLALLLPALFAVSPQPLAWLALVIMSAASWEWGRLNGLNMLPALGLTAVCMGLCAFSWLLGWAVQAPLDLWWVAGVVWVLGGVWMLRRSVQGWAAWPPSVRWMGGIVALWLTWLAICQSKHMGVNYLLSVLALVWVADVAAYFGGRAFGRRKLAANISPGKSWEGVFSGFVGVCLVSVAWLVWDEQQSGQGLSVFSLLRQQSMAWLVFGVALLVGMSVVGDLIESLVKRSAGFKDSSSLLPGHGGVLDRIDALLPTLPLALLLVQV
ncbi:MAG: phosphatidate cytidylyltransferase [Betaproteobacteria bacterium]|nr:phosphatidate cytidylyltransferase [Betaproteobacteria bacterium]NBY05341.1 phosphatidate cytidylyltransferase [Betaproteobacteria bacterium]